MIKNEQKNYIWNTCFNCSSRGSSCGYNRIKVDMKNDANTKIYVYIGKEFDNNDIEQIAKETFETDTAIVQKVEIYNEMALITIKEQNTEKYK